MARITAALLFACALLAATCSHGPDAALRGTYRNDSGEAALEVTADEIIVKSNWVTFGVHYRVLSVSGSAVTVELSSPNVSEKGTMVIRVNRDSLVISRGADAGMFAGT